MQRKSFHFSQSTVDYYFAGGFSLLKELVDTQNTVFVTDSTIFSLHEKRFRGKKTIVVPAGEKYKVQSTVDDMINQLIQLEADRKTTLVGVGGGVITDLTGYVASVYMRGIRFGFIPTTILALVDASIGGKNGIDVGLYKNMVGVIRQPSFLLHDLIFLNTLPEAEWRNGFAEIIKHAAIKDVSMFRSLEATDLSFYRKGKKHLCSLIQRNAFLKTKVVQGDEFESGERKLLNFGHTLGHALENQYHYSHGEAISIGMAYAARLSAALTGFKQADRLINLLERYGLPTAAEFDKDKVIDLLKMDKKRAKDSIDFILLNKIGKASIHPIPITQLYELL